MSNVITREYLLERFVYISREWVSDLHQRLTDYMPATATVDWYDREVAKAIHAEEDRQIKAGIQASLESNMKHNNKNRRMNWATARIEVA